MSLFPVKSGARVAQYLIFSVLCCRSLFVIFWSSYCRDGMIVGSTSTRTIIHITTKVVSSIIAHGELYWVQLCDNV
jgi:hypothetical protein